MKRILKTAIIIIAALILMSLIAAEVHADETEPPDYLVTERDGTYVLSVTESGVPRELGRSSTLGELLVGIERGSITFDNITAEERLTLSPSGALTLGGTLFFEGEYGLTLDGTDTVISMLDISFESGCIRNKSGTLTVQSGRISSGACPVIQDFDDSAVLIMTGGELISSSSSPALSLSRGSAVLSGGSLSSLGEYAVESRATLTVASVGFSSAKRDVYTEHPIRLAPSFGDELSVTFGGEFEAGTLTEMLLNAAPDSPDKIELYDKNGRKYPVTYFESSPFSDETAFCAVYLPFTVEFRDEDTLVAATEVLGGMKVSSANYTPRTGYEFVGWFSDAELSSPYSFDDTVSSDMTLYASKRLTEPEYRLSTGSFVYTGQVQYFSLDMLTHPLLEESTVVVDWYKNGELAASGERLAVRYVADSGDYSCVISLYHARHSVSVRTPSVSVEMKKAAVAVPSVAPKAYTSEHLMPDVERSTLYSYNTDGGVNAGTYPVTFTLLDSANYMWEGSDGESVGAQFEILRAENRFLTEPAVFDVYFLAEDTFSSEALFGNAVFYYYERGASVPLSALPVEAGEYTAVAAVEGTANYTALRSSPIDFLILEEKALGISIATYPSRTEYTAFEVFSAAGLTVIASYSSGRTEAVGAEKLSVRYQSADSLRAGDSAVLVSYLGSSVAVPVTVRRADYDLTGVLFDDTVSEYNGIFTSHSVPSGLPIGLDGVPLLGEVTGGGVDAGVYTVTLTFSSASSNYNLPSPMTATVTVTKKTTELSWSAASFVYNGKKQAPAATFTDVFGVTLTASVIGGEYNAGDSYTVTAASVANYEFTNPTCVFSIAKADFDLSGLVWSEERFVYDSSEHTVTLSGLPNGLRVTGYVDNAAALAGVYHAAAGVSYDAENYNAPVIPAHRWEILPAAYDLSGISFESCEAVYDGSEHFPSVIGSMPTGLDGITPEFSFSRGASHVSDGTVSVTVTFTTESKNYTAPPPIVRTVTVTPAPIYVSWQGLVFTYDGWEHIPTASSVECAVSVSGAAVGAGEHTATASSESSDFYVANPTVSFVIEKAENRFTYEPFITDVFEGSAPAAGGEALFGEVLFSYYADASLTSPVNTPTAPGIYYAVAAVPESDNYLAVSSGVLSFEIIAVVPVGISTDLLKSDYIAFETLSPSNVSAQLRYNDGSTVPLDASLLVLQYQSGSSFRAGDTQIAFSYGEFSCDAEVHVGRAAYDLSGVAWQGLLHTYDGEEKRAYLEGLPAGITLISVEGGAGTLAGEYAVRANITYDTENYDPPVIPEAVMVIEKAVLPYPTVVPVDYDGNAHAPSSPSPLWTVVADAVPILAGEYKVTAVLTDSENYVFEGGETAVETVFVVSPREILVRVGDVVIHPFEEYSDPSVEIIGEILPGDTLDLFYTVTGDTVSVGTNNPNYKLKVEEGRIIHTSEPSEELRSVILVLVLLLILLILLIVVLILQRHRIAAFVFGAASKRRIEREGRLAVRQASNPTVPDTESGSDAEKSGSEPEPSEANTAHEPHLDAFPYPMDTDRADSLISNTFAKDLVSSEGESVYTSGWRKSVVNIDTLSENFSAGERIDVNTLKSMSLIPYDTAYIKVLARGMIDKPLFVYANDFSHTAVKMLALTGGKAVKVTTVKVKKGEYPENKIK